jgi:hypothetical protein
MSSGKPINYYANAVRFDDLRLQADAWRRANDVNSQGHASPSTTQRLTALLRRPRRVQRTLGAFSNTSR